LAMPRGHEALVVIGVRLDGLAHHPLTEGDPEAIAWLIREFVRRIAIGKQGGERG
jgi:hypothetical protein